MKGNCSRKGEKRSGRRKERKEEEVEGDECAPPSISARPHSGPDPIYPLYMPIYLFHFPPKVPLHRPGPQRHRFPRLLRFGRDLALLWFSSHSLFLVSWSFSVVSDQWRWRGVSEGLTALSMPAGGGGAAVWPKCNGPAARTLHNGKLTKAEERLHLLARRLPYDQCWKTIGKDQYTNGAEVLKGHARGASPPLTGPYGSSSQPCQQLTFSTPPRDDRRL